MFSVFTMLLSVLSLWHPQRVSPLPTSPFTPEEMGGMGGWVQPEPGGVQKSDQATQPPGGNRSEP